MQNLNKDLVAWYPKSPIHGINPIEFKAGQGVFVVACLEGQAVGCGAFRPRSSDTAEIKRMFVRPEYRGQGISKHLLAFLEQTARSRGFTRICLEAELQQPEAIALYHASGYRNVPTSEADEQRPISVCFEKVLP